MYQSIPFYYYRFIVSCFPYSANANTAIMLPLSCWRETSCVGASDKFASSEEAACLSQEARLLYLLQNYRIYIIMKT